MRGEGGKGARTDRRGSGQRVWVGADRRGEWGTLCPTDRIGHLGGAQPVGEAGGRKRNALGDPAHVFAFPVTLNEAPSKSEVAQNLRATFPFQHFDSQ